MFSFVSSLNFLLGPDEEDDEPLLSGSGEVSRVWSEEEVSGWADVLLKWKDQQTRPSQLVQLVRKVCWKVFKHAKHELFI